MTSQREYFHLIGQAFNGAVPLDHVELVLDTNVVGLADSIARKGYRETNVQHRRVRALWTWIAGRSHVDVNLYLGAVEGANFDGFAPSPYNLLKRVTCAGVLFEVAKGVNGIDPFDGTPVIEKIRSADLPTLGEAVDDARDHYARVVLPNYIAILSWHLSKARRPDADSNVRLREVLDRVIASMDFVPLACTMLGFAEWGSPTVADVVGNRVLKLRNRDLLRSARSGAWDVGFLSALSGIRAEAALDDDHAKSLPVLVTDDEAFAAAARLLPAVGNTGTFHLDAAHYSDAKSALGFADEIARRRRSASPRLPRWEELIDVARTLEGELGVEEHLRLHDDEAVLPLAPDPVRMASILDIVAMPREEMIHRIEEDPLQLYAALTLAAFILKEMGGDPEVHLFEALRRAAPEAVTHIDDRAAAYPLAAVGILAAWAAGDDTRTMAYLESLEINFYPRLVKLMVLVLCAELIELSARTHNVTRADEMARWRAVVSALPVTDDEPRIEYRRRRSSAESDLRTGGDDIS